MAKLPPPPRPRAISPEVTESVKSVTPELYDPEARRVVNMMCSVKRNAENGELLMTVLLRMADQMNRQLTCAFTEQDTSKELAQELVNLGFINENDRDLLADLIEDVLQSSINKQMLRPGIVSLSNLPGQATLLLPPPEYPSAQHFDNSSGNTMTSNNDDINHFTQEIPVVTNSNNNINNNNGTCTNSENLESPANSGSGS